MKNIKKLIIFATFIGSICSIDASAFKKSLGVVSRVFGQLNNHLDDEKKNFITKMLAIMDASNDKCERANTICTDMNVLYMIANSELKSAKQLPESMSYALGVTVMRRNDFLDRPEYLRTIDIFASPYMQIFCKKCEANVTKSEAAVKEALELRDDALRVLKSAQDQRDRLQRAFDKKEKGWPERQARGPISYTPRVTKLK